jgi:hypothetical protein
MLEQAAIYDHGPAVLLEISENVFCLVFGMSGIHLCIMNTGFPWTGN